MIYSIGVLIGGLLAIFFMVIKNAEKLPELPYLEKVLLFILGITLIIILGSIFSSINGRLAKKRIAAEEAKKKDFYRRLEKYEKNKRW